MKNIEKIHDAICSCRKKGMNPVCILCRFDFYDALYEDVLRLEVNKINPSVGDGKITIFGIRLARTPDIDKNVKMFEVVCGR